MDALAAARKRLESRIHDPKVKFVPGLADDLRAIDAAFAELDARTAALAAFVLRSWSGVPVIRAQIQRLSMMGPEAAAILRIAEHGDRCTCCDCMRNR